MFFIGYSAQGTELRKCSTDWIIDKQMMQISFVCGQNSIKKMMRQAEKEKQKKFVEENNKYRCQALDETLISPYNLHCEIYKNYEKR